MKELPLLSVIVPVYNVEKYLDKCILSIVEQTYNNLEIILVDDGSSDNSGAICDAWAEKDNRIKVIHKVNGGGGEARNVAMDIASGELVGMVDSDDYLEPHMYEHLYQLMDEDVDITECTIRMTESDECPLDDGSSYQAQTYSVTEAMLLHIQNKVFLQTPPNKLYRYRVIKDVRFPVGTLIDDEFWTYRVIGNARKLVHSSCCMYAYRQQQESVMNRPYSIRRLDGIKAMQQRLKYIKEKMPDMSYYAQANLLESCMCAMQLCMRHLDKAEQKKAWDIIAAVAQDATPLPVSKKITVKKNVLMLMCQVSLKGTARFVNFMEDIHVFS